MKVYVTGMGALTSLGLDVKTWFQALKDNRTGVRRFDEWEQYNGLFSHLGAPVPEYDISLIPRLVRRSMSRMSEMAAIATFDALRQAGLRAGADLNNNRTLILLGSTTGSPWTLDAYFKKLHERHGPEGQLSTSFFKVMNHSVAANVAAALDYNGALLSPASACSTSTQAMITGWELLRSGLYDRVIAGGADELHYMTAAIFDIVQAASRNFNHSPDEGSRPFDERRDGLVVSEGAGVLVMESEAAVAARNAKPLAEIGGGAYLCDGSHMSQSSQKTMAEVMRETLRRANVDAAEVGYVNAHATGTVHGDAEEAKAIHEVFGSETPVSSLKGHLGHSLAACGAIEAIAAIKMMDEKVLIPTRNLTRVAADCASIRHLRELQPSETKVVLSNNFAFGGMSTSLLIRKFDKEGTPWSK